MPRVTPQPWQAVLQKIIRIPGEKQRLIAALKINPMTLNRWLKAEYQPNRNHLIALLEHVPPQFRQELQDAIVIEHPEFEEWVPQETLEFISSPFYLDILETRAVIMEAIRNHEIIEKTLKEVLVQLDPMRLGMAVTLAQCMPPQADGKIHSLRERIGRGSPPWTTDLDNLSIFLAMESLAGYVVQNQHSASIEDISKEKIIPAYQTEHEVSAAAAPIMFEGKIAGCLLVSSTEINHFTQHRMSMLNSFSNLISLGLSPHEFYPHELIQLGIQRYKSAEEQRGILLTFRQRVREKVLENNRNHSMMTYQQGEECVWAEFEAEVIQG